MKKILIVAAAAGLMSLAACNTSSTQTNSTADNVVDSHEANADFYQEVADNSANATVANANEKAEAVEENAAEAAENKH